MIYEIHHIEWDGEIQGLRFSENLRILARCWNISVVIIERWNSFKVCLVWHNIKRWNHAITASNLVWRLTRMNNMRNRFNIIISHQRFFDSAVIYTNKLGGTIRLRSFFGVFNVSVFFFSVAFMLLSVVRKQPWKCGIQLGLHLLTWFLPFVPNFAHLYCHILILWVFLCWC